MTAATGRGPAPDINQPLYQLTPLQVSVLGYVAQGRTNLQIARKLTISEQTVKTHLRHICQRLQARDRAHAVHVAHLGGLFAGQSHQIPLIAVRSNSPAHLRSVRGGAR